MFMHAWYPDLLFWLFFGVINAVIFLPSYLLHRPLSSFFPDLFSTSKEQGSLVQNLLGRSNQDIFRVSADLAMMSLIGLACATIPFSILLCIPFGVYFIIIILFQITNAVFRKIYHKSFTNLELLQYLSTGHKIMRTSALYQVIMIAMLIVMLFGIGVWVMFEYLHFLAGVNISIVSIALLLVFVALPFYIRKKVVTMFFTNKVFPLHLPEIYQLFFKTNYAAYQKVSRIDFDLLLSKQPPSSFHFHTKPNVYVIVIESYGRMVLDESDHPHNNYVKRIAIELEKLAQDGWHCASSLAESPIAGGGSWIAYSSFLFGINMQNQMMYEKYFSSEKMHGYNHLFRFLKSNGYKNYRVNAVGKGFDGITVAWDAYSTFYAVDEWIHFKDMAYVGQMYGFGPAPPDQFILHQSAQVIDEKNDGPHSYFLLTQNSHSPFYSLPVHEPDWQTTNTPPEKRDDKGAHFIAIPKLEHYFDAIDYELETVFSFIRSRKGNDVFIVFGDHQPPVFDQAKNSMETPVHIIGKNKAFLDTWLAEGFNTGLMPEAKKSSFRFEGMLSLFIRAFVKAFSTESDLPEYHPMGNKTHHEQ
jgi:hypothetical protein